MKGVEQRPFTPTLLTLMGRHRRDWQLDGQWLSSVPAKAGVASTAARDHYTALRNAVSFCGVQNQFSLSDYFKAIRLIIGGKVDERDETVYVAIRRFDDGAFVLPSGQSLIAQLMRMGDRLIIEDVDLTARHLREHLERFDLDGLCATDVTDRQRMRGASMTLVEKIA